MVGGGLLVPINSTRTTFEDNGDSLYTILRRVNNHLPENIVEGFPWCTGTFQNRTVAAGEAALITPVYGAGWDMVVGNRLVIPEPGIYIVGCQRGLFGTTTVVHTAYIKLNSTVADHRDDDVIAYTFHAYINEETTFRALPGCMAPPRPYEKDDYITFFRHSVNEQTLFTTTPMFGISRIA